MGLLIDAEILERVKRLEIPFNAFGIDPYGATQKALARSFTMLAWLYRHYFRVTQSGIDNIPARGRAMLIGNHSGGFAVDGGMVLASCLLEMEPPRLAQGMAEKFLGKVPFAGQQSSRAGQLTGLPEHAERLLKDDRLLLVFPEGAHGTEKLYGDRNTLVKFGTGFMRLALRTRTPIIPFAVLGGGDAVPTVINLYKIAKLIGVPYIPVTAYLLPVPRPVPMEIYYSPPMTFAGDGSEEDDVIAEYVSQVKARIAELIAQGERIRRGRDAKGTR